MPHSVTELSAFYDQGLMTSGEVHGLLVDDLSQAQLVEAEALVRRLPHPESFVELAQHILGGTPLLRLGSWCSSTDAMPPPIGPPSEKTLEALRLLVERLSV